MFMCHFENNGHCLFVIPGLTRNPEVKNSLDSRPSIEAEGKLRGNDRQAQCYNPIFFSNISSIFFATFFPYGCRQVRGCFAMRMVARKIDFGS